MTVLLPWLLSREISNIKVMLPLIADKLLGGISFLTGACEATARTASGFTVNSEQVKRPLMSNPILLTGLNLIVDYKAAAAIAKPCYLEGRPALGMWRPRRRHYPGKIWRYFWARIG